MADVELKSCPFCGAPAEIITDTDDDGRFAAVACPRCGAGSRQHYFCGDDAREFAADAWNRRTPDPALSELLEVAAHGAADKPIGSHEWAAWVVLKAEASAREFAADAWNCCADTIRRSALGTALVALRTIQGMEPVTHEITLAHVMAQHATDALGDIARLSPELAGTNDHG